VLAAVIVLAALGMRRPAPEVSQSAVETGVGPARMLATPIFWVMFVMMSMVATGGLMAISQLGPIAASLGIGPGVTVLGLAALPLALTLDRIANGITRPFFGWLSDRIGRESTMLVAFTLEAAAVFLLMKLGSNPVLFVLFSALVFFGWGEIYSLFPSLQADVFGQKHAVQNLGWLLIGTAVASVLGAPVAALLVERTGSWTAVFYAVIVLDLAAALMAVLVLGPMRRRALLLQAA
jgi:OFA family oxalate/formate antiporter-like MFS transporter